MKNKILLVSIFLFSIILFGCNETNENQTDINVDAIADIWSAKNTEKILQDKVTGYEDIKLDPKIDVIMAKGEYEASQLIITSMTKINNVDLVTSDLTLIGGTSTLKKENIEVFYEKYVTVSRNFENNGAPTGKYPDALVPIQNVIDAKENTIESNNNQGLYVRFKTGISQPAGVYSGNFILKLNNKDVNIPVQVNVIDIEVSEEAHCKTLFLSEWQYRLGELDSTQEMLEKYIEAGLEYRISPAGVRIEKSFTEEGITDYIETAIKYMKNPKCTNISIMFKSKKIDGVSAIDPEAFEDILNRFVERSIQDNTNYVKKLGTHLVDEPNLNSTFEILKKKTTIFKEVTQKVSNTLSHRNDIDNVTLQQELVNSLVKIPAVITCPHTKDYDQYSCYIDTWCPTVDYYDSADSREYYDDQEEKWWYTCISPRAPYPTYHTEDTLLSARLLSWMQAEYDVVGNLFWATNVYARYDGSKYVNIEDFYSGDASRYDQVNGDGYLFYPGKQYGIDGPIGSLRLEAIRDGQEEFEIIYALRQKYQEISEKIEVEFDEKKVLMDLSSSLYNGTKVATNSEQFATTRKNLYNLALMSLSNAEFAVIDCKDNGFGVLTYKIFANSDYQVLSNNQEVQNFEEVNGGKIYDIDIELSGKTNILNITVKNDEESYTYSKSLGGNVSVYNASTLVNCFTDDNAKVTASLIDASTIIPDEDGEMVLLDIESTTNKTQGIKFASDIFQTVNENTKKIILYIYCDEDNANIPFAFSVKYQNSKYYFDLQTTTLHNGLNEITISLENISFEKQGSIEYGIFYFGNTKNETAKQVYVRAVSVYGK